MEESVFQLSCTGLGNHMEESYIRYIKKIYRGFQEKFSSTPRSTVVQKFGTVKDGIDGTDVGECFYVEQPAVNSPFSSSGYVIAAEVSDQATWTDGRNIFLVRNESGYMYSFSTSGDLNWSRDAAGEIYTSCFDGNMIFAFTDADSVISYTTNNVAGPVYSTPGEGAIWMSSNGDKIAILYDGKLIILDSQTLLNPITVVDAGINFKSCVVVSSDTAFYTKITGGTDVTVISVNLADGSVRSGALIGAVGGAAQLKIQTDGKLLYIHNGGTNLYCYGVDLVGLLWTNTAISFPNMIVDEKNLYITNGLSISTYDKHSGVMVFTLPMVSPISVCTDGIYNYVSSFNGADYIIWKVGTGKQSVVFKRVSGTDPSRSPYFTLAVPL